MFLLHELSISFAKVVLHALHSSEVSIYDIGSLLILDVFGNPLPFFPLPFFPSPTVTVGDKPLPRSDKACALL
jgi:hypothetical protein